METLLGVMDEGYGANREITVCGQLVPGETVAEPVPDR